MSNTDTIINDAVKEYSLIGYSKSRRELPKQERKRIKKGIKEIAAHEKELYKKILATFGTTTIPVLNKTEFNSIIKPEDLNPNEEAIIYLSNHKCHLDELATVSNLYLERFPYPLIAAGENLFTNNFVEHIVKSLGAFKFKRKFLNDKEYTAKITAYLSACIKNNKSLMFYPEGTRPRNGKLKDFEKGFLYLITNAFENLKHWDDFKLKDIKFVPIYINYSYNPDESYLTRDSKTKAENTNILRQWRTKQKHVEYAHIEMGNPVSYIQLFGTNKKELSSKDVTVICEEVQKEMKNIAPIFKEHLVYKVMKELSENNMDATTNLNKVEETLNSLEQKMLSSKKIISSPNFNIYDQFQTMEQDGIIEIFDNQRYSITKQKTFDYYTNSVDTLLI